MLDTSIENQGFHMLLPADIHSQLAEPQLPPGYSFRLYKDGDEQDWARIETAVGEFSTEEDALAFFQDIFLSHTGEPERRTVFVQDPDGNALGTASAWFAWDIHGDRLACLHYVATLPEAQGLGLGRATVLKALSLLRELEPGTDIVLHTQTRSHVAVGLYHRLGFHLCEDDAFIRESWRDRKLTRKISRGDYRAALKIMAPVISSQLLEELQSGVC